MLQQHNNSKAHREEVLKLEYLNQPTVSAQLDNQRKKDQEIRHKMFLVVLSSLRYLLRA